MNEREKLNKRHQEILNKAIDSNEVASDLYDIDETLIHYALKYVPIKVLKKIFARYEWNIGQKKKLKVPNMMKL